MLIILIWPALIGAGVAAGASWIGARGQNKASRREARRDRSFQERMRNTSWQAGVKDMEAAGLNPALAYSQGGAAQAKGAMATQQDVISPAVSSAQHGARLQKEMKLLSAQANESYNRSRLYSNQTAQAAASTQLTHRQTAGAELSNEMVRLNMFSARNNANMEKSRFGMQATYANRLRQLIFGGSGPGSLLGGAAGAYIGARSRNQPITIRRR